MLEPSLAFLIHARVSPKFLDPEMPVLKTQARLPHWQQDGRTYFVTFRLADALPSFLIRDFEREKKIWLAVNPQPWSPEADREYHERFSVRMDHWLDENHGECLLRDPAASAIVAEALAFFEGTRSRQLAWVVMPNHVHTVFSVCADSTLESLMQSWKGFTGRKLNEYFGRNGAFWQRDYFDRLIRDPDHLLNVIRYIRRNPIKARLREGEFRLWEREDWR